MIRPATIADAAAIATIYNHYVLNTTVSFEEEPITVAEMERRIDDVLSKGQPWLVSEIDGVLAGYAYASRWHARIGYRFTSEITVYLDPRFGRRGLGSKLYDRLFPLLEQREVHSVLGIIALPNAASVALHEKFGLKKVAHFSEVGTKFGQWIDVGYWQRVWNTPRMFEREDLTDATSVL